jgi:hypothetical protein
MLFVSGAYIQYISGALLTAYQTNIATFPQLQFTLDLRFCLNHPTLTPAAAKQSLDLPQTDVHICKCLSLNLLYNQTVQKGQMVNPFSHQLYFSSSGTSAALNMTCRQLHNVPNPTSVRYSAVFLLP